MIPIKQYIAQQMIGQTFRFKCECLIPFDVVGRIIDYEIAESEIIFTVDVKGKLMQIGTNHPKLHIGLPSED